VLRCHFIFPIPSIIHFPSLEYASRNGNISMHEWRLKQACRIFVYDKITVVANVRNVCNLYVTIGASIPHSSINLHLLEEENTRAAYVIIKFVTYVVRYMRRTDIIYILLRNNESVKTHSYLLSRH